MTAQFWLYYGSATAFLLAVLAVVDILGHRLLSAYRRYQVRKEFK
jgi:hypothetical protein